MLVTGGEVTVPLTKGTTKLKIPPLTQSNTVFKLKGKGIKHLNSNAEGNLNVVVIGESPKSLSKEDKQNLKQLEKSLKDSSFSRYRTYLNELENLKKNK